MAITNEIGGKKTHNPMQQYRESRMSSKFCYEKRIGLKEYQYPADTPYKPFAGQVKKTGMPICEAHLYLTQHVPKRKDKTGGMDRHLVKPPLWRLFLFIDIVLNILAEELIGVSFFYMDNIMINNIFDGISILYKVCLYGPWALISLIELLDFIPNALFFIIELFGPWHWFTTIGAAIDRIGVGKQALESHDNIKKVMATENPNMTTEKLQQYQFPEPVVNWSDDFPDYKAAWNPVVTEVIVKPSTVATASKYTKRSPRICIPKK